MYTHLTTTTTTTFLTQSCNYVCVTTYYLLWDSFEKQSLQILRVESHSQTLLVSGKHVQACFVHLLVWHNERKRKEGHTYKEKKEGREGGGEGGSEKVRERGEGGGREMRERKRYSPSMLSIIFHCDGLMLWWNPNHTSLPLPRRYGSPSGWEKNDRPTGVYLWSGVWGMCRV